MVIDCVKDLMPHDRALLVKQLRRWGDLNTDAILDCECKRFSTPNIDGFIGYRLESNCAVVFGDPICEQDNQLELAQAFKDYCKEQNWDIIYTIISQKFANKLKEKSKGIFIQFGNKLILDPFPNHLERTGPNGVLVRKKVKHAHKDGITVQEYLGQDPHLEEAIQQVGKNWLTSRHGAQIYISHLNFFNDREGKRWFYALKDDKIVGFLILNEIQENRGWLLNNLILSPEASSGVSELLITSALHALEAENCRYVAIGPVTAKEIVSIMGTGKITSSFLRLCFKTALKMFHLDGQRIFWDKFLTVNEPSYLMFEKICFRTIRALFRALNVSLK
jgi:lysylphosphatidylglycerol synthetase-like protein (DUF2156 family)